MIIVRIIGGLGNQLFQYSCGRALAIKYKTDLKLDLSYLKNIKKNKYTYRTFYLDHFKMTYEIASYKEIMIFTIPRFSRYLKLINQLNRYYERNVVRQKNRGHSDVIDRCKKDTYLIGTWQSEKYFNKIRDIIKADLRINVSIINTINRELINLVKRENSVSIHIRKGDYLTNKSMKNIIANIGLDYYEKSINYIRNKIKKPSFFLFTDDHKWLSKNWKIKDCTIVNLNNELSEFYTMSLCKHNIIANSTFSWWAAWLNENPNKIVISPKVWVIADEESMTTIIPPNWIKLS